MELVMTNTFNLPNLLGNVAVGAQSLQNYNLGDTGGEAEHTLEDNELPKHRHADLNDDTRISISTERASGNSQNVSTSRLQRGSLASNVSGTVETNFYSATQGDGTPLSNRTGSTLYPATGSSALNQTNLSLMQPYVAINYIIKT